MMILLNKTIILAQKYADLKYIYIYKTKSLEIQVFKSYQSMWEVSK